MFTSKKLKSVAVMALAFSFVVATLASCGAKKEEEVVEEVTTEEVAPTMEAAPAPADTTATDTTAAQ